MPLLEIVTLPNPVLRRKAHKLANFDQDLRVVNR